MAKKMKGQNQIVNVGEASIPCIKDGDTVFVFIKPICEYLGVDTKSQYTRIISDEIFAEAVGRYALPDKLGKAQNTLCLPIHHLHGWLLGIQTNSVKPEVREKLVAFKKICYQALFEYFFGSYKNVRGNHGIIAQLKKELRNCKDTISHNKAKSKVLEKQIEHLMRDNCIQLGIDWDDVKSLAEGETEEHS